MNPQMQLFEEFKCSTDNRCRSQKARGGGRYKAWFSTGVVYEDCV